MLKSKLDSFLFNNLTPARVAFFSFAATSFIGGLILMLPVCNSNGEWRDFIPSFFMSCSATCVAGLAVVDLGKDFTFWGQLVTLILIQIGGLGYMTLTTIFIYIIGQKLSLRDSKVLDFALSNESGINFADFIKKIGIFTLFFEILGAFFLFPSIHSTAGLGSSIFSSIFHSISSFCNAGLSLYPDNLMSFKDKPVFISTMVVLTILGGLGYTVMFTIYRKVKNYLLSPIHKKPRFMFPLFVKVCLAYTLIMLVIGTALLMILIYFQDLTDYVVHSDNFFDNIKNFFDNLWIAFVQMTFTRSSGFNIVDITTLQAPSLVLMIFWMFMGACPGGTGGGIKGTTVAVIMAIVWAEAKNRSDVRLFNRSISSENQRRTVVVFITGIWTVMLFSLLINVIESGKGMVSLDEIFEITSAFGTVGLSTGITTKVSNISLLLISFTMIIGRSGPLLVLMSLIHNPNKLQAKYPEENILIG